MATYERSVRVEAPFETVWEFHSDERGLVALTPDWMHLEVERTRGPDGEPDPEVLEAGAVVESSVRPFGVGPRQSWVSEIVARDHSPGSAYFRDVMSDGPFAEWVHTHLFYADDGATIVRDSVDYELPFGVLGRAVAPFSRVGFEPMFRFRHRETKRLLEDGSTD
jgi:ligand-binding SRPBCC domain-containing protein